MTLSEITNKILTGTNLAVRKLIERKQREDGYIVISENGQVVKKRARDIDLSEI